MNNKQVHIAAEEQEVVLLTSPEKVRVRFRELAQSREEVVEREDGSESST